MTPRLIPVIDLSDGRAVHAIGGDRARYRPVRSILHGDADPLGLARAYRDVLGLEDLYLADLDAIAGASAAVGLYRAVRGLGLRLWVDAGIRDASSLPPILDAGVETIVVGLETLRGPAALAEVVDAVGPDRACFSLDLRDGSPAIADGQDWNTRDPRDLAEAAIATGLRRLILLDLGRVGTSRGTGTLPLLRELASAHPGREFTVGGGIAGRDDIKAIADAGASCVLIGSALHDGRIGPS